MSAPRTSGLPSWLPAAARDFASFDGGVRARQRCVRPDRYRALDALPPSTVRIVRGGGYSYAAAGMGGGGVVEENGSFDRLLALDPDAGILECESGATLGRIYEVAAPLGWHLAVQPGYPRITIGGCVAADAHGKNQFRDGTFRRQLLGLRLFHPRRGTLDLGPASRPELFDLTCGGFGLTGRILTARLRLQRLPGRRARTFSRPIPDVFETPDLLEHSASDAGALYTWHDFTATGAGFGRGFLHGALFVPGGSGEGGRAGSGAAHADRPTRRPRGIRLLSALTIRSFNLACGIAQRLAGDGEGDPFDSLFPAARKMLYFRLFGRKGFHEYQMIVPRAAFPGAIRAIRRCIERERAAVCLASMKLFRGGRSLLRFEGDGICLALDFPRTSGSGRFAALLDSVMVEHGGVPNIIKDSRIPRDVVRSCCAGYETFLAALHAFDPDRLYRSELSERLGL